MSRLLCRVNCPQALELWAHRYQTISFVSLFLCQLYLGGYTGDAMNVVYGCHSPSRSSQTAGHTLILLLELRLSHYTTHTHTHKHTSSIIIRITLERHFSSIYTWANNSSDWRLGERTDLFGLGELVGWVVSRISLLYIILHWRERDTKPGTRSSREYLFGNWAKREEIPLFKGKGDQGIDSSL